MNIGSYEHAASCVAKHYGLQWNDKRLALKELGASDCVFNLFFVSVNSDKVTGEFIYMVDRVEITKEVEGLRVKLPYFVITDRMSSHLDQINHRLWFITIADELVRIKDKTIDRLVSRLAVRRNNCMDTWFEQEIICSEMNVRMPYLPKRGKQKKPAWT